MVPPRGRMSETVSGDRRKTSSCNRPSHPFRMPTTSYPSRQAARPTARMAAFSPGASPPPVSTPTLIRPSDLRQSTLARPGPPSLAGDPHSIITQGNHPLVPNLKRVLAGVSSPREGTVRCCSTLGGSSVPDQADAAPQVQTRSALTGNVLVSGLVSFFTDASSEMIVPVLPLFVTAVLGASMTAVGLIEGVAESTASVMRSFAGLLSDRFGRRKALIVFGYSLSHVPKPLLALTGSCGQVLAIRFGDRLGKGIRGAPRDALIADSVAADRRGLAFGFHRSLDTAGAALGPLIAFATLAIMPENYRAVFWIATIPGALAILIAGVFLRDLRRPAASHALRRVRIGGLRRLLS